MTRLSDFLHRAGLAAVLGLAVAVAADAQPADRGLDARLDRLAQGLDLSAEQSAALDALATQYAQADRADLWAAAAQASSILTDAQIDQLQQAVAERRGERGQVRPRGERGHRSGRAHRGDRPGRGERADRGLDDAQRQALREIRADVRAQAEALADQLRQGSLSDDEFRARTRALREEGMRRSAEVLPAEAAAQLAERQAQRQAVEAAREKALGLTAAQKEQLEARRVERVRESEGRPDLRPFLDADGRLDRRALGEAMRERREAMREARGERDEILTEDQQDVAFLYGALAGGRHGRGHRGGRRGR
ncbi:hypothetical protein [Rubrivirga sp.]|uniref:hypothetical protein n=1 Tax=Rubrivirga sp. TaxID=1885344 RepID=UPI003B521E49